MSAQPIDQCGTAIARLEHEVSRTGGSLTQWRDAVGQGLSLLADALAGTRHPEPVVADGYRELERDAPRLSSAVHRLDHENRDLRDRLDALLRRVGELDAAALKAAIGRLIADVRRYRRHAAALIYEAYTVDIGGET